MMRRNTEFAKKVWVVRKSYQKSKTVATLEKREYTTSDI